LETAEGRTVTVMVCFTAADAEYCLPVHATRSVRAAHEMISLPNPSPDVSGMLPGDPPLTVISPLHSERGHILVIEAADKTFGLLVDAVTGLRRVDEADVGPPPDGQDRPLISGTLYSRGRVVLVADPSALAGQL
jgi:chemotaxis signal transduction protein